MSEKRKPKLQELPATSVSSTAWQPSRLPDNLIKLLSFRDGVAFFLAKMEAGGEQPIHQDRFRQIRYVVEGEFVVNGKTYGAGTTIDIPEDTSFSASSPNGGQWFVLEMPGTTSQSPGDPRLTDPAQAAAL